MSTPFTVRTAAPGAPAGLTALALAALTACRHDATPIEPSGPPSALAVTVVAPAGDTLTQLGLEIRVARRDTAKIRSLRLLVDSGLPTQRQFHWAYDGWYFSGTDSARTLVYAPGAGRHTFTIATADSGSTNVVAHVTRTFVIPDVAYAVTALPDLGAGAGVEGMNDAGEVAGWVALPNGLRHPAVWRSGQLTVVPTDSGNVVARRVNGAGDVLLQYFTSGMVARAARVRRADGTEVGVGPVPLTAGGASPGATVQCCTVAADLNERRQAVGTTVEPLFYYAAAQLDVGRGALTDSAVARWTTINDAGQVAGTVSNGVTLYISTRLVTLGFPTPPLPNGTTATVCDLPGRFSRATAIDLDDAANLLADVCGNPALLPHDGQSQWIDRYVGRGQVHLAPTGGLVASLDASGEIFLWRAGTTATSHARLADTRWHLDSLAAVTSSGAIGASGVDASGKRAALLLTPAGH